VSLACTAQFCCTCSWLWGVLNDISTESCCISGGWVAAWRRTKPILIRDVVLLPLAGFLGVILLWWVVATFLTDLMPTPAQALVENLDNILHPFYRRGPGNLGLGWLLLASLRRVLIGFALGAIVAIPVGFLIGMSKKAMLALNPIIQILSQYRP
jgi:nitrate/nitrite transport system permease protein